VKTTSIRRSLWSRFICVADFANHDLNRDRRKRRAFGRFHTDSLVRFEQEAF
jgi:hypothetical protein